MSSKTRTTQENGRSLVMASPKQNKTQQREEKTRKKNTIEENEEEEGKKESSKLHSNTFTFCM